MKKRMKNDEISPIINKLDYKIGCNHMSSFFIVIIYIIYIITVICVQIKMEADIYPKNKIIYRKIK